MKRLVSLALAVILFAGLWTAPASASVYGTVRGGWLRLRAEPSYQAYVITSYPTGTVVTILSQSGGWCQVVTPDQRLGYMDQRYLTISGSVTPGYVAPTYPTYPVSGDWYNVNQTAYVTSANGKGVRLRRNPVVNGYNVIGLYPVGRRLTVLKRSNSGWSYVRIGNQEGYMMSQFITTQYYPYYPPAPTPTREPSYRYTAYLTTDNGRNIYLRRDASMNFQYIASYPVGTKVTVLGTEGSWTRVLVDGLEGYVQSIYVTTRRPAAVTPIPGYYPDPPTEPVYVDPEEEYIPSYTRAPSSPNYGITSVRLTVTRPKVGDRITVVVAPNTATYTVFWTRDDQRALGTSNSYTVRPDDVGHRIYVRVTGTGDYSGTVVEAMTDAAVEAGGSTEPTPVPEGVVIPEWVDDPEADPAEVIYPEGPDDSTAEDAPVVTEEWVDQTPIDSWWTGEDDATTIPDAEWVDPW